ncbi:UDP-N-acetylmuramoyl-L-alanyl-D-glutamate--2,6-diaminopimelate ligase [Pseudonocardia sp. D17]|uniref:UDP-N-acetylmuramoyl-L-alanyl-D-glutamate--2, 6-diaminopimelate ligase n=1 Tax=Pseudonocardia sp. D17 TaxID=882661 RepID=UPI0030CE5321
MPPASSPVTAAPPRPDHVRPVDVAVLAASADAELRDPAAAVRPVTGATLRASDVRPGDLFAALPGSRAHGADFTAAALAAGAVAILTDPAGAAREAVAQAAVPVLVHEAPRRVLGDLAARIYGDPTARLDVVGVTGTSGKTTVGHMLEAGLAAGGRATGLLGTVTTRIRGAEAPSLFTTPESPDLQALFAVMAERGVTDVAMEVSSHALALDRVAGTRFSVAAFTNLSQDHLDFHRDMDDYFEAKALLFDPSRQGAARRRVVCVDDEWGRRLADRHPDAVTVATTGPADWTAEAVHQDDDGTQSFVAARPGGTVPVRLRLPGRYNVANALVALACLDAAGVPAEVAAPRLAELAVPGRMQRVDAGQDFLVVVDYAHKPAAVGALLAALRGQVGGRIVTVLGCGGDRDRGKRPLMGAIAAAGSDLLVVTDDNPRTEDPAAIRRAVREGAEAEPRRGEIVEIGDRRAAIAAAVAAARPGDAVVVAGKGHEKGQEIDGVKHPFDDVDEVRAALRSAGGVHG